MTCNCANEVLILNPSRTHKNKDINKAFKRVSAILTDNANHTGFKHLIEHAKDCLINKEALPQHECQIYLEIRDIIKSIIRKQSKTNKSEQEPIKHLKEIRVRENEKEDTIQEDITANDKSEFTIKNIERRGKKLIAKIKTKSSEDITTNVEDIIKTHKEQVRSYIENISITNPRKYAYLIRTHTHIIELFQ